MPATEKEASFEVSHAQAGSRLDAALRRAAGEPPWSRVRGWIHSGKVLVDDCRVVDPGFVLRAGQTVLLRMNTPRVTASGRLSSDAVAYVDAHVVVVRKPPGISSIAFEPGERGTLHELVRAWLNRTAHGRHDRATGDLGVVHRIDKETSGLLVFTRSLLAKRHLAQQLRAHSVERSYLALVHGQPVKQTLRSRLVADRGDGVRGSTTDAKLGREAVTHVTPVEPLPSASMVQCTLETGRTHQIRIHLAEAGHPLIGERVYTRGLEGRWLQAPRLMLHAAVLGFEHPATGKPMRFEEPLPEDMRQVAARLRGGVGER
jgi:23S rRNA pseudouridine1911/1915/1917 synthase